MLELQVLSVNPVSPDGSPSFYIFSRFSVLFGYYIYLQFSVYLFSGMLIGEKRRLTIPPSMGYVITSCISVLYHLIDALIHTSLLLSCSDFIVFLFTTQLWGSRRRGNSSECMACV